jgi:hypothetical protein
MSARRLLLCAAVLHVAAAVALFVAGRAQLAPGFIDRDGIIARLADDSLDYQQAGIPLTHALRRGDISALTEPRAPLHVRAIALSWLLLSPLFGYSTLAAEPFNLLCYLAVVGLVYAIGREAMQAGRAWIPAAVVAVWPSFLFHTLQLLKDALFIAGTLTLILIVLTWLTRSYRWAHAALATVLLLLASGAVIVVRGQAAIVVSALLALGLAFLLVRQVREKRSLLPNVVCAIVAFVLVSGAVFARARVHETTKHLSAREVGEPKETSAVRLPTAVVRTAARAGVAGWLDRTALHAGSIRNRYAFMDPAGGSGVDHHVPMRSARDVIGYLPRALTVGLWAPFPPMWIGSGHTVGRGGRMVSGTETLVITGFQLIGVAAILLPGRRVAQLFLLAVATLGVASLAIVVTNIGSLYRFRYSFWMLFIVLGVAGASKLRAPGWRPALAALALIFTACGTAVEPRTGDVHVLNFTGFTVQGVYLAPQSVRTWQENILSSHVLRDGDSTVVHLANGTSAVRWDVRVDGEHGYRAEWKSLDLSSASTVILRIENGVVIADVESRS